MRESAYHSGAEAQRATEKIASAVFNPDMFLLSSFLLFSVALCASASRWWK